MPIRSPHRDMHLTNSTPLPLVARGYRFKGRQRVDLFWSGSTAESFRVYRDGQCLATVSASPYTDRLGCDGSGSYRYMVRETATGTGSNDAAVTFSEPGNRRRP
jgi:hypothetical protein